MKGYLNKTKNCKDSNCKTQLEFLQKSAIGGSSVKTRERQIKKKRQKRKRTVNGVEIGPLSGSNRRWRLAT